MRKHPILIFLALLSVINAYSQQQVRRLPSIINHPSLNLYAPYISSDGNALVFISDNGQDGAYIVNYVSREADWSTPVELPKHINNRLNFMRGYALSADGKRIYVTSAKSPVIGGYDIFTAELKGNTWTNPENLMLPINSKTNEACPSVTPDGSTIYFMRCDKMDAMNADGCKIFRSSKKSNGQWAEPEELPAHINTGNSQAPRIMADKQTLIFSSDKMLGNKGGMDLFITKMRDGSWSEPVPLDFASTERNDQYVSVAALGRYLLKESKGAKGNYELTEFLIPSHLRPQGLMKLEGKITDLAGAAVPAYISITDLQTNKRIYAGRPLRDGSYFTYLPEGSKYEFSVDPEQSHVSYYAKVFDLTTEKIPQKEKVNVTLKTPSAGDELPLDMVYFKPYSSELETGSYEELKRLARLAKANPALKFEIQVLLKGYREDMVASDPDLTEVVTDSSAYITDSLALVDTPGDTTSLDTTSTVNIRTFYHNDRTVRQSQSILDYLKGQGVNENQLTVVVNSIPATDSVSTLTVKARVVD